MVARATVSALTARGGRVSRCAVSASRIGTSFADDSATSASGSDPATMPQPAKSRIRDGSSRDTAPHRSAMPHSPSPVASIHPTGPA